MMIIDVTLPAAGVDRKVAFTRTWSLAHGSSVERLSNTADWLVSAVIDGLSVRHPLAVKLKTTNKIRKIIR